MQQSIAKVMLGCERHCSSVFPPSSNRKNVVGKAMGKYQYLSHWRTYLQPTKRSSLTKKHHNKRGFYSLDSTAIMKPQNDGHTCWNLKNCSVLYLTLSSVFSKNIRNRQLQLGKSMTPPVGKTMQKNGFFSRCHNAGSDPWEKNQTLVCLFKQVFPNL